MKNRALVLILALVGMLACLVSFIWVIVAGLFAPNGTRVWKIIDSYDMIANVWSGGDEGEYVTTRAYKASLKGNKWGCLLCKFLDWLQPMHCEKHSQK